MFAAVLEAVRFAFAAIWMISSVAGYRLLFAGFRRFVILITAVAYVGACAVCTLVLPIWYLALADGVAAAAMVCI